MPYQVLGTPELTATLVTLLALLSAHSGWRGEGPSALSVAITRIPTYGHRRGHGDPEVSYGGSGG